MNRRKLETDTGWTQPSTVRRRRLIGAGILLFLTSQIALPASYYFGDELTSERFAWRMFSSVDLSTFDARFFVTTEQDGQLREHEVSLQPHLQESYIKSIQQAQLDIVGSLMRRWCEQPGVREVRFEARGRWPSGKPMTPIRRTLRPGQTRMSR